MREPPARGAPRAVRDFQKGEPAVKRLEDGGSCEFI
jgi:hypothetical protein